MNIELTPKESKLLSEFLALDLDEIGFNDKEQKVLNGIYEKLNPSNQKKTDEKVQVSVGIQIPKVKPHQIKTSSIIASERDKKKS